MSGPLPDMLAPLTGPASRAYGWFVARRNRRYDRGAGVVRAERPVISVGNITVGGVGKTPFVRWVVERLRERGRRPAIALRGYGAAPGHESDEAVEYRTACPDVDVIVGADRAAAIARALVAAPAIDCVVLDDGFQHRRLHRDLDLVLVDATRPALDGALLPRGWLREPPTALARADGVIVTRADGVDDALAAAIEEFHGRPPIAWARHAWRGVLVRRRGSTVFDAHDVAWLDGRRVVTLLGIGNPAALREQLRAAGATIVADASARDHERFAARKLRRVAAMAAASDADAVVTTGKDWARAGGLIDLARWPVPVVVPDLALEVVAGASDLTDTILRAASSASDEEPSA